MKLYTKLFIAGAVLFILPPTTIFCIPCLGAGFILLIVQGITEITNRNAAPRSNVGQPKYTYTYNAEKTKYTNEARRACENVTPKRKKDEKPPWEE